MENKRKIFEKSLFDVWQEEIKLGSIVTSCRSMDEVLGGGIPIGKIIEFCGGPGSGKTNLCFQLCVNVQIPAEIKGCDGSAIFIDTNQGFSSIRLKEIASFLSERLQIAYSSVLNSESVNVNTIMENIFHTYCENYVELIATVERLPEIIKESPKKIKLIVIDSFSFLFRTHQDYLERTRLIYQLLTDLQTLAYEHKLAVVLTNEMTTGRDSDGTFCFQPSLGESLSHKVGQRIILGRTPKTLEKSYYLAYIKKSTTCPQVTIPFQITANGIKDHKM